MNKLYKNLFSILIITIIILLFQGCPFSSDDIVIPEDNEIPSGQDQSLPDFAESIFVSNSGTDASPGTQALPVRTITRGLSVAETEGKGFVLVASGIFNENSTLILKDGISIYGSIIESSGWELSDNIETTINVSSNIATSADNISSETSLNFIKLVANNAVSAGNSSYGMFITNTSSLTINNCEIEAGNGLNGINALSPSGSAQNGDIGIPGQSGCENSSTFGCSECSPPTGGSGGISIIGLSNGGGSGGLPGLKENDGSIGNSSEDGTSGGLGTPSGRGNWEPPSVHWGVNGTDGSIGSNGAAGSFNFSLSGYTPINGANGLPGLPGKGGGGGGGGGGGTNSCDSYGGAGSGGGSGGAGGLGADGGSSGSSSFAVFLWNSNITVRDSEIITGQSGNGGNGGTGQSGGAGGNGGAGNDYGGSSQDDGSNGGKGGNGGTGGNGGHGGGGSGGSSIGIVIAGGSFLTQTNNTFTIGSFGSGGSSSGNNGPNGLSQDIYP